MHPDARWLSGKNAHQVIGDLIEQEVGGDASDAAMFGLAHGAMRLPPCEMHSTILGGLRPAVPRMPRDLFVNGNCAQELRALKNNTDSENFQPIKQMRLIKFDGRTWQAIGDVIESRFGYAEN